MYNFERVIRREVELSDAMVDVQLGPPYYTSRYLAFENDRVAVATVRDLPLFLRISDVSHHWTLVDCYRATAYSFSPSKPTPTRLKSTQIHPPRQPPRVPYPDASPSVSHNVSMITRS